MNLIKLVTISLIYLKLINSLNKIKIVKDIVATYNFPTVTNGFFCNTKDKIEFIKEMYALKKLVSVSDIQVDKLQQYKNENNIVFVLDLYCDNVVAFLRKAEDMKLFKFPYRWIFTNTETKSKNILLQFNFLIDSNMLLIDLNNTENYAIIYSYYKRHQNDSLQMEIIGNWNIIGGYKNLQKTPIAARRRNLMGTILKASIVVVYNESYAHLTDRKHKIVDTYPKISYLNLQVLRDILNATMVKKFHGSWTGTNPRSSKLEALVGDIAYKKTDIAGTGLFMTEDRISYMDYTMMATPTKLLCAFRQPKLSYVTNIFILPFNMYVWIATFVLVLLIAVVLYLAVHWEAIINYLELDENNLNFGDAIFLAWSAVCQQGSHVIPTGNAGRFIIILLFLSIIFLYTSYSAHIIALLQSSSNSIKTLKDLLESSIEIGVDDIVYNRHFFPLETEPIRKLIYLKKIAPQGEAPHFYPMVKGVQLMRQKFFAFCMEVAVGYKFVSDTFFENEKCGLQEMQYLFLSNPAVALQKNSSYKEIIKIALTKIQETGLQQRELAYFYTKKPECVSSGNSYVEIGVIDCYAAFVVLAFGAASSLFVLIMEILFKYRFAIKNFFTCTQQKIIAFNN